MAAPLEQLISDVTRCLDNYSIPHFIFGAVAAGLWGEPRYTLDVDFVVILPEERFGELVDALREEHLEVEPGAVGALKRARMLRVRGYGVTADLVLGETDFDRQTLGRRRKENLLGLPVYIASPEDTILYKLIAHRYQDLADIEKIITRRRDSLDQSYLKKWAAWLARETGDEKIAAFLDELLASGGLG